MNSSKKMKKTCLFEMPDSCLAGKGYLCVRFISDHPLSLMRGVDSLTAFHFFKEGGAGNGRMGLAHMVNVILLWPRVSV